MIYLLAHLRARPDDHAEIMTDAKIMIAATRAEPGCILYDLNVSITDPQSMIFVEMWESREALTAHFNTPHMAVWRDKSGPYFIERKIVVIHPDKVEML